MQKQQLSLKLLRRLLFVWFFCVYLLIFKPTVYMHTENMHTPHRKTSAGKQICDRFVKKQKHKPLLHNAAWYSDSSSLKKCTTRWLWSKTQMVVDIEISCRFFMIWLEFWTQNTEQKSLKRLMSGSQGRIIVQMFTLRTIWTFRLSQWL